MSKFIDSNVLRWVSYQATVELERKLRTGELFPGHISLREKGARSYKNFSFAVCILSGLTITFFEA